MGTLTPHLVTRDPAVAAAWYGEVTRGRYGDRPSGSAYMSVLPDRHVCMAKDQITLDAGTITGRGNTLNPFIILEGAAGFITFAGEVFDAREVAEARIPTPTGKLIHAELRIGDSLVLLADAQEGWRTHSGMFQIWTIDVETMLRRAVDRGSVIVTPPTPFYGSLTLARMEDPWGNLWWVYQPAPGQPDPKPAWDGGPDTIFRTIDEYMRSTR